MCSYKSVLAARTTAQATLLPAQTFLSDLFLPNSSECPTETAECWELNGFGLCIIKEHSDEYRTPTH